MRLNKRVVWPFMLLAAQSASGALAEPDVQWRAPVQCPQQSEVRARIEQRVRGIGRVADALFVSAEVDREADHFRLRFLVRSDGREAARELVAPSCDELVDALTWLVAIGAPRPRQDAQATSAGSALPAAVAEAEVPTATVPAARTADAADAPPPAQTVQAAPEATPVAPRPAAASAPPQQTDDPAEGRPAPSQRRLGPRWLRGQVGAGVWSSGLPKAQALLQGGVGVGFGALLLELRFAHLFERGAAFADDRSVRLHGNALTALGCGLFRVAGERLRVGPCAHVVGMYTVAFAPAIASPRTASYAWLLGGVSAQAALTLYAPVELIAEAGLSLPLGPRPGFAVAEQGEVARTSALSEHGSLAIGARW